MNRYNYPDWLVPKLSTSVPDYVTMKAKLGAQVSNAKRTDKQIAAWGKKAYRAYLKATTPEQRAQWRRAGAAKANADRTPEEKRKSGQHAQAARMQKTTQEQRTEWARKAGKASAAARWGDRA